MAETTQTTNWTVLDGNLFSGGFPDTSAFANYNKITEEDLKKLKNVQKQKIVFTKPFLQYKVGDVLEVKVFPNTLQSEPPSFLVIDEKLGSAKYGFGGRGSTPFYELYKEQPTSVTDPELLKKNMELSAKKDEKMKQLKYVIIAVVLVAGYFAYKKYKK
jgi:hypothetical protein